MFGRREPPSFEANGRKRQLIVKPMAQARRMRLAIDPRDGCVRLTLPKRASLRQALAWVEERRDWIEAELGRIPDPRPITPDSVIPLEGVPIRIDWAAQNSRIVRRAEGRLIVGGPMEAVSQRVLRWLKREALAVLDRETKDYAALAEVEISRVSVGDPRGRWGSCSSSGDIRYSWRLILMPPDVRRATVAHEVAHRLHMDHSPAFHAAAERLFGRDPAPERRWLRQHGSGLHWVGRDG